MSNARAIQAGGSSYLGIGVRPQTSAFVSERLTSPEHIHHTWMHGKRKSVVSTFRGA